MSNKTKFIFTGELSIPRDFDRFFRAWDKDGDYGKSTMASINFGVKDNPHNIGYVGMFGMANRTIKTMSTDNKALEIEWEDRLNPDYIKEVAYYRKHYVNLGEEYGGSREFITEYDTILFLSEWLPQYHGKVRVTGEWRKRAYNGKISDDFVIQNVTAVAEDEVNKLQITMDLFYNGDSVDEASFNEDGKIFVNGYVKQYVNRDLGEKYFQQTAILCNAAYDMTNEQHAKRWALKKKYIEGLSKKKMYHMSWNCRYINGAEEVEFDESMLTDEQREAVAVGLASVDDYKPAGNTYGARIQEVRLAMPVLKGEFSSGVVKLDETVDEFEEDIFRFVEEEKLEEIKEETLSVEDLEEIEDEESLF